MKTHTSATHKGNIINRYQNLIIGNRSWLYLIYFEFCMFLQSIPGAIGLLLRKLFWPRLFASCSTDTLFGCGIILRHPKRIHIGRRVVISENCILDARHKDKSQAIFLENDVILANDVMISSKEGKIKIGARTGIGARTIIQSIKNNAVIIDSDVVIGPQCYIVAGGNYNLDRLDLPISQQNIKSDGGIKIGQGAWLGGGVKVLGGVNIGLGSIAGAGCVITKDVPPLAIYLGQPARLARYRN